MKKLGLFLLLLSPSLAFAAFDPLNNGQIRTVNTRTTEPTPITTPITTPIPTTTPVPTPVATPIAQISQSTGEIIVVTTSTVEFTVASTSPTSGFAVSTPEEVDTTIQVKTTVLVVKPKTIVLVPPTPEDITKENAVLIRGTVQSTSDCSSSDSFTLRTILADILSSCTELRAAATDNVYSATYSQTALEGSLTVKVTSGSVLVTERSGTTHSLAAGSDLTEVTIQTTVPRSTWILPIDKLYGGQDNLLVWTPYEGAAGYIIEYNILGNIFAEENSVKPEYTMQTILLKPGTGLLQYQESDGVAILTLPLDANNSGTLINLETRIFAVDENNQIISDSLSSDKVTVSWE